MKEIKTWTIDEYYKKMKEYFQNSNETGVVKIISIGFGCSYQYWIKPSLMSKDKYIDIFWNHEPLMKRYFSSKSEMEKNIKVDFSNVHGFILRWLWRDDEIVYQPTVVEGDVDAFIKWYKDAKKDEYFFGLKMDPFTYIGHIYYKKDAGEEYFDDSRKEYEEDCNYRVFYQKRRRYLQIQINTELIKMILLI